MFCLKCNIKNSVSFLTILLFFALNHTVIGQVNSILNINTSSFYILPSEVGANSNKWELSTYLNSKKIISTLPIRNYVLAGNYQLKRGLSKYYLGGGVGTMSLIGSPYKENELHITISQHRIIRKHTIHWGIQPIIHFRNLDVSTLLFPDQFDRSIGAFNSTIASFEPIDYSGKEINSNLNLGLGYGLMFEEYYSKINLAYRNLNLFRSSKSNDQPIYEPQFIVHGNTKVYIRSSDIVNAFIMYKSSKDKGEVFIGGQFKHDLLKVNMLMNELSVGSYLVLRNNDNPNNIVFNFGFGVQKLTIGMAYSYNFLNKGEQSEFNTFELVLTFKELNRASDYYKVPCEIY